MAGPIFLYFDVWPAATPDSGAALGELTQAYDKKMQDPRPLDVGSGEFRINRHDAQAAWCDTGNLVRVRLETGGPFAWDDSRYVFAFYIEDGADHVLDPDEEEGEEFTRGGRAIFSVLERLRWWKSNFMGAVGIPAGDNRWHWQNDQYGDIFRRSLQEWNARPSPKPIPSTLTWDFSGTVDSNGDSWPSFDGHHYITIGTDYLAGAFDLMSHGIEAMMTPAYLVRSFVDGGGGTDRSATVAFRAGWNIRESSDRQKYAPLRGTRALVRDADGAFFDITDSHTAADEAGKWGRREAYVETGDAGETGPVTRVGRQALAKLRRLETGPLTLGVTSYGGGSDGDSPPAHQDRIPYTDYFPGDTVTVDIAGEYSNKAKRIVELTIADGENGEAEVTLTFDAKPFDPLSQAGAANANPNGGNGGPACRCIHLCAPGTSDTACVDLTAGDLSAEAADNGDCEDPGGGQWSGGEGYVTASGRLPHGGTYSYGNTVDTVDPVFVYTWDPAQVFLAGVRYVVEWWDSGNGFRPGPEEIRFGKAGIDEEIGEPTGIGGDTDADGGWAHHRFCWTPTADRTGVRLYYQTDNDGSGSPPFMVIDDLELYTAAEGGDIPQALGASGSTGTDGSAARCDHRHPHGYLETGGPYHEAKDVTVTDAGGFYAGSDVETILQEIGPALASGGLPWIFPWQYGAVGDDSTDDTAAVQACIDASYSQYRVYIDRKYKITDTISVTGQVFIYGEQPSEGGGMNSWIRQATHNKGVFSAATAASDGSYMEGVYLLGPGPSGETSGNGIYWKKTLRTNRCRVEGFYNGYLVGDSSYYGKDFGSFFYNHSNAAVNMVNGANNFDFSETRISYAPVGLAIAGSEKVAFHGGAIEQCSTAAVRVRSGANKTGGVIFSGVYFEGSGSAKDIWIGDDGSTPYAVTVQGCKFTASNSGGHIVAAKVTGLIISGNDLRYTGTNVSIAAACTGVLILPNRQAGSYSLAGNARLLDPETDVTPSSVGASNSAGTSRILARADHVHQGATGVSAADVRDAGYWSPLMMDGEMVLMDGDAIMVWTET